MSTSLFVLPRFVGPGSRSALPVTPRTNANQLKRFPHPMPNITAAVSRSPGNQTIVANTKRFCDCKNSVKSRNRQPRRRVYLGAPRCSKIGSYLLPPMFGYKNFGTCSDPTFSRTANTNTAVQRPNPYTQLAKEVKQMLKQKADSPFQLNTAKLTGNIKASLPDNSIPGPVKVDIVNTGGRHQMVNGGADSWDEQRLREHEAHDGEICDDEEELYRELRSDENAGEATIQFETYKALHQAKMEDTCKLVQPRRLIRQLTNDGYFDYSYYEHSRAPLENPNPKPHNAAKPTDRLYLLLSIY